MTADEVDWCVVVNEVRHHAFTGGALTPDVKHWLRAAPALGAAERAAIEAAYRMGGPAACLAMVADGAG